MTIQCIVLIPVFMFSKIIAKLRYCNNVASTFFFLGVEVDFNQYADPHLAATTLKMFLRELPEPLLCFDTISRISLLKCNSLTHTHTHSIAVTILNTLFQSYQIKIELENLGRLLSPSLLSTMLY